MLDGGKGDDRLEGGAGNDSYKFGLGSGWDVVLDESKVQVTTTKQENYSEVYENIPWGSMSIRMPTARSRR